MANPRYPVYVPTKGRAAAPLTIRALQAIGVPFSAVVEPQEAERYAPLVGERNLLVLPHRDQGLVVTRNWIWDHARDSGAARFWTFDDNIRCFYRLQENVRHRLTSGTFLRVIEDFVERYENVPIAGMAYHFFVKPKFPWPPFITNTRVYSNMLIETNACDPHGRPYRNEGFYNDDTDLCLRVLKDGYCTIEVNVFQIAKVRTMTLGGGMTPYYVGDGRYKMAHELAQKHPDVVRIIRRFGRWQHYVDYRPFRRNRLRRRPDVELAATPNEYGMVLVGPA